MGAERGQPGVSKHELETNEDRLKRVSVILAPDLGDRCTLQNLVPFIVTPNTPAPGSRVGEAEGEDRSYQ